MRFDTPGLLLRIACLLKEYAHKHDLAVVLTNHVHDHIEGEGKGKLSSFPFMQSSYRFGLRIMIGDCFVVIDGLVLRRRCWTVCSNAPKIGGCHNGDFRPESGA